MIQLFLLISFWISQPAFQIQNEAEVRAVIESLFEGMKSKDETLIRNAFHPEARMQTVATGENGTTLGSNSVADFVNRIATTPANTILDERIQSYDIRVDGDLASVWTPYKFYVNEGFSHCGVNSFQLIKTSEGWKITYIIDTRRKTGCDN